MTFALLFYGILRHKHRISHFDDKMLNFAASLLRGWNELVRSDYVLLGISRKMSFSSLIWHLTWLSWASRYMCTTAFHFGCPLYSQSCYFCCCLFKLLPNKLCLRKIHVDCCFCRVEASSFGNIWRKRTPQCFINFLQAVNNCIARSTRYRVGRV